VHSGRQVEGAERGYDGRESNKRSVLWWRARLGLVQRRRPKRPRDPARHRVFRCTFESAIRQPAPAIVLRWQKVDPGLALASEPRQSWLAPGCSLPQSSTSSGVLDGGSAAPST